MAPNLRKFSSWFVDALRVWLPTMALVAGFLFLRYQQERIHQTESIEERHQTQITEAFAILRNRLAASVRDIRYLADTQHLELYLRGRQMPGEEPRLRAQLAEDWRRLMASRPAFYDQIRYLDPDGRERIRINNDKGVARIVPESALQQKFDRYYVQEARRLPGDLIYLSRLDLNVERGVVETPLKPMLRLVASPLQGRIENGGLLVLNFLAKPVIERLRGTPDGDRLWLLDPAGYWLLGDDPDQEWGFMLPMRRQYRLEHLHPELHAVLQSAPPGPQTSHRRVADGVFSYQRYDPGAYTSGLLPGIKLYDAPGVYWTVARWSPASEIDARMAPFITQLTWIGAVLTLLISLGSGHLAWLNRRRAEAMAAEREAAATLERFIESAPDGIIVSDTHGQIVLINKLAEQWLGYESGELLGRHVECLVPENVAGEHPELPQSYLTQPAERAMSEGHNLTIRRKDGSEFPVSISVNTIPGSNGPRIISAIRDIAPQLQVEAALRASNAHIEQANREARQANQQLREANGELESFAYSVSHDLRAPLRSVDGFSNILLKSYGDKLDDAGRDYLQRMRAAAQRMSQMIDDILILSRISRDELKRAPVDLSALAGEIARQLQEGTPQRAGEFIIAPGLSVEADPALVRVALDNLLGNAWKYTGKTEFARIEFTSEQHDDETVFVVRDNGAGFDPAYADKLFGAFQRLHHASDFPGNGIGLATVMRVVRKHGGRIWAEAAVGQGATFRFTLGEADAGQAG